MPSTVGYAIALFQEDNGQTFASAPQSFVTQQNIYNFYFPDGGCPTPTEIGLGAQGLARCVTPMILYHSRALLSNQQ